MLNVFKNMRKETRVMTIVTIAIVFMVGVMLLFLPRIRYNKAMEMLSENKLVEAREIFINLGDYKDANEQLYKVSVRLVQDYFEKEEYYDALSVLYTLHRDDTKEGLNKETVYYIKMFEYYTDENYEEALEVLNQWMRQVTDEEERERCLKFREIIMEAREMKAHDSTSE